MEGPGIIVPFVPVVLIILIIAGVWITFTKAGQPGWAAIIPIYNLYILVKVAGKPGWWFVLFLIPVVNIVVDAIVSIEIAKKFGEDTAFGVGLFLIPFVFFPILAFTDAQYVQ